MNNTKELFTQVYQKQFERIMEEFNKVSEYVYTNFSDVEFKVEFNDDSQNPAGPSFKIKTRLFTGKEMSLGDRMLKKHEIKITPDIWEDNLLMTRFIETIYPGFTQSITKEVNGWYQLRKAKKEAGVR